MDSDYHSSNSSTEHSSRSIFRIFKRIGGLFIKPSSKKKTEITVDDLSKALELTPEEIPEEKEMLEGFIKLYSKTAVEIMTSRLDIASISHQASFGEIIQFIIKVGYSRIPVYVDNQDNIKGILYIKDILPHLQKPDDFYWLDLIRPAFFVPETKKIDDLLDEFRANKIHLAVVVDEFGGVSGIVTLEDILEEIVGEIHDEHDTEEFRYSRMPDGSYVFDAKMLLADFFKTLDIDAKVFGRLTEEVDTLAGLILEIKGDFPEKDEVIIYKSHVFKILDVDKRRILRVSYSVQEENREPDQEEE